MKKISVNDIDIYIHTSDQEDYISLTDMLKAKDGDFFISDWLRNRNTLELLATWEQLHNSDFNYGEFAIIAGKSGLNSFKVSVKEWVARTNAIGLTAKTGRYGGTFAHQDITFEFGTWISPQFKLYLIKEYQRLKADEQKRLAEGWSAKRPLTKINYRIHTDAIKRNLLDGRIISKVYTKLAFASEADILNLATFGQTAANWKTTNKSQAGNIRDYADVAELVCLANLESINAIMIDRGIDQAKWLEKLIGIAQMQLKSIRSNPTTKKLDQGSSNA